MKVKEANDRLEQLKRLNNNVRLLKQYFFNKVELDEEIVEATGMNTSVRDALDEISIMVSKYENAILEAEIGELTIH